ncbi:hypothetical protein QVD17_18221 [Tagetes erecta]|uniref:Uncharacterized protein n=1 Tax=Tagetes erecta TaxID=13708 RepID=A0AAD8KK80_TARER|nr:hypothetical protein QVD17_18221 [Tagetes erecta]
MHASHNQSPTLLNESSDVYDSYPDPILHTYQYLDICSMFPSSSSFFPFETLHDQITPFSLASTFNSFPKLNSFIKSFDTFF